MNLDDKHAEVDKMLVELQKYIDELNKKLISEVPTELRKSRKTYTDIIKIAGELDDYLSKW